MSRSGEKLYNKVSRFSFPAYNHKRGTGNETLSNSVRASLWRDPERNADYGQALSVERRLHLHLLLLQIFQTLLLLLLLHLLVREIFHFPHVPPDHH
jgi:hypothetical protein